MKPSINKEKIPAFRKKFAGKVDFKDKSFTKLAESTVAYLLEVRSKSTKQRTFQVIDNDQSGKYPENRTKLNLLNPFSDPNYKNALGEYKNRNQLSLNL